MIIVGYQGVGKSSISGVVNGCIDLESGNFWANGKRGDDWYIVYANMAQHLSKQGFTVCTSSHKVVRNEIAKLDEVKVLVYPCLDLKEQWIDRLQARYDVTQKDKDYKALMNAKEMYNENIQDLMLEERFIHLPIKSIPYNLKELISSIKC